MTEADDYWAGQELETYEALRRRTEANELVWHFTGWSGLEGIVVENELRASSVEYLNDASEFWHAYEILSALVRDVDADIARHLKELARTKGRGAYLLPTFVASFTREFDTLQQWRGYGGPSTAFAIGFHRGKLENLAQTHSFLLTDCLYTEEDKKAALAPLVETYKEAQRLIAESKAMVLTHPLDWRYPSLQAGELREKLHRIDIPTIAAQLKHESFSGENECRLIISDGHNLMKPRTADWHRIPEFHPKGHLRVPHVIVPLPTERDRNPIAAVLIGPTGDAHLVRQTVDHMVRAQPSSREGIVVARSIVPYRNW